MSSEAPLISEVVTYGLMILNMAAAGLLLLWSWRRGHLDGQDDAAAVLFADDPPLSEERDHE